MRSHKIRGSGDENALFIIRPVSSDQTDFIRDSKKMSKGNKFLHKLIAPKQVRV